VPCYRPFAPVPWLLALSFLLVCPSSLSAQKTVVKDAGSGVKQEFDCDAVGRVTEVRTFNPDGILNGRIVYTYGTHSEIAKQVTTNYWRDGHGVHLHTVSTNDQNSNLISEVVEEYDQAGNHFTGHEIFADPMTGIYRCFNWNAATRKYVPMECPSGEEGHEGPKAVLTVNRDEVMLQLANARRAAQAEQKSRRILPKNPTDASAPTASAVVGIVLPAALHHGQRVSGSVVGDPDRYAGYPALRVVRFTLPAQAAPDVSRLGQWSFEAAGAEPQPADGPISLVLPAGATAIPMTLRSTGDSSIAISQKLEFQPSPAPKAAAPGFQSPALCFLHDICPVAGTFSGDSRHTFAAFDSNPARVLAQTESVTFVEVPEFMMASPYTLIVADGDKVAAMMMAVANVAITAASEAVLPGHELTVGLRVSGIAELAPQQWHYGIFPADNLERARALVPGFNPSKVTEKDREQREKREREDGVRKKEDEKWEESAGIVLLAVRNLTPDVGTLRGFPQQLAIFRLSPESFDRGDFVYSLTVDPVKSGTVTIQATAIPFLAPVKAQVFEAQGNTQK
jgi:hypothetical protein